MFEKCDCNRIHLDLHRRIKEIIKDLQINKNSRILDVGCWDGLRTKEYGELIGVTKSNTFGIEIVDEQFSKAQKIINCTKLDLEKDKFPYPNNYFDLVIANQVFEHLKNIYLPMSEIQRTLKPSGYFIFSVPNLSSLHNRLLFALGFQPTSVRVIGPHIRGYAFNDLPKFLEFNDHFRITKKTGVGFYPSVSPFTNILANSFKGLSHTVIWVLEKQKSNKKNWQDEIDSLSLQSEF